MRTAIPDSINQRCYFKSKYVENFYDNVTLFFQIKLYRRCRVEGIWIILVQSEFGWKVPTTLNPHNRSVRNSQYRAEVGNTIFASVKALGSAARALKG